MATIGVNPTSGGAGPVQPVAGRYDSTAEVSGWTGWIGFAGMMLIIVGVFDIVFGLVGIFNDDYYVVPTRDLIVTVDYTAWGWTHLIFGVVAIAIAIGMMAGAMWGRVAAVILAVLNSIVQISFLNAAPVWSTIMIAFNVLVIWAVVVHGGERKLA